MNCKEIALILNKIFINTTQPIYIIKGYLYSDIEWQEINIKGISKTEILRALFLNSTPASFFILSGIPAPSFDDSNAEIAVASYIDYFCGRLIKSDISKDLTYNLGYNREYGAHAYEKIILHIIKKLSSK